ncbi:unnamed protein product [Rodentolepis nana]|uniref:ZP domain-containing protein n=1 Tax=Rodentolepis nana TaxID=102285 RepID=A0A0R3T4K3_RODNA|nr:unnamed protein product [Rodentolepis nana]
MFCLNLRTDDDLLCDDKGCKVKVDLNDYVQIERALKFGIQVRLKLFIYKKRTTFLRISGTFKGKDVTHIVFSKGSMQATLLVHRASDEYPQRQWRVQYTSPHMLPITGNYSIAQPIQVILPFFATEIPEFTAYFGPDKVDNVFTSDNDNEGVLVKFTGSRSTLKVHGKVIAVPYQIEFHGETPNEYFTISLLSSTSLKFNSFLILIALITTAISTL